MENYEYHLDVIGAEIQKAANLLNCFTEFCDEEGEFTETDNENKAICFVLRLKTFRSLVEASLSILYNEIKILNTRIERGDM